LLEFQIAILLLACLVATVAQLVTVEAGQVRWLEEQNDTGGTTAVVGFWSVVMERALPPVPPDPTGNNEVEILDVTKFSFKRYAVTFKRYNTGPLDCGN
jgi:hypothetical protein